MKFRVEVVRIGYAIKAIEVEAVSKEVAQTTVLDVAGNEPFNEHASQYRLVGGIDDAVNRACKMVLERFQQDVTPVAAGWDVITAAQKAVTKVGET